MQQLIRSLEQIFNILKSKSFFPGFPAEKLLKPVWKPIDLTLFGIAFTKRYRAELE